MKLLGLVMLRALSQRFLLNVRLPFVMLAAVFLASATFYYPVLTVW